MVQLIIIHTIILTGSRLKFSIVQVSLFAGLLLLQCKDPEVPEDSGLDLQDELDLSAVLKEEVDDSGIYGNVLSRGAYSTLYDYIDAIQDSVLKHANMERADDINFEPIIIDDMSRYQAFSLPGGVHYYYSGLLLYLENEAQLVSLMTKEMTHNENTEPFNRIANIYGEDLILQVIQGGQPDLKQEMINTLLNIGYVMEEEEGADLYSVSGLCGSSYKSGLLASIYEKATLDSIIQDSVVIPNPSDVLQQYFTFYPLDSVRINAITSSVDTTICTGDSLYEGRYEIFLDSLKAAVN